MIAPDLTSEFKIESGQVTLKKSLDERNKIEFLTGDHAGMFLDNESAPAVVGEGFDKSLDKTKIRVGYATPYGTERISPYMVTLDSKVERIFDSSEDNGSNLINFREVDVVLAGDMYRVQDTTDPSKYKWYLVLSVTDGGDSDTNNRVATSEYLGTW